MVTIGQLYLFEGTCGETFLFTVWAQSEMEAREKLRSSVKSTMLTDLTGCYSPNIYFRKGEVLKHDRSKSVPHISDILKGDVIKYIDLDGQNKLGNFEEFIVNCYVGIRLMTDVTFFSFVNR